MFQFDIDARAPGGPRVSFGVVFGRHATKWKEGFQRCGENGHRLSRKYLEER